MSFKAAPDPAHDRDSLRVSDRFVARAVWAFGSGLPTPWDQRVIVGESLQALAFPGGEATDSSCVLYRNLATGVGVAVAVPPRE